MPSAFEILGLEPSLDLGEDQLRQVFQSASIQYHPDQGGSVEQFEQINRAYQTLKFRPQRIIALLEHFEVPFSSKGDLHSTISDLFQETGDLIQHAKTLLKQKDETTNTLSKALLEPKILELQQKLSTQITQLNQSENTLWKTVCGLEELEVNHLQQTARSLTFIQKWRTQLQECFARCW